MIFLRRKSIIPALLIVLQSGCSQPQVSTGCDRLQQAIYSDPQSAILENIQTGKQAAIYASKQQLVLADQLDQIPLLDEALNTYRNHLVDLYRHDSDLGLQVATFMSNEGDIVVEGSNRSAYEQVAKQRISIGQQAQQQQAEISNYCKF